MYSIEKDGLLLSRDKDLLDISFIHDFLTTSYWAGGRSREEIRITIDHSICYGLYAGKQQIAFARVLSDRLVFAYLMDLFVNKEHRGKGYASMLTQFILADEELKNVKKWMLATADAHGLYRKFGFETVSHPERLMEHVSG